MGLVLLALALAVVHEPSPRSAATWVFLRDKGIAAGATPAALARRARELSPRALERRRRVRGDAGVDVRDLPIAAARLGAIESTGARIRVVSRWLTAVSVEADAATLAVIAELPWVRALAPVAGGRRHGFGTWSSAPAAGGLDPVYGFAFDQLAMLGIPDLHACGLSGEGVVVGVLDSGFVLDHVAFADLDVVATHDFVNGDDIVADEDGDVSGQHAHGTMVLSLLAGRDEGTFMGAAPDVSVILAKTEDVSREVPIEEDHYVAGLEWIESLGADMTTASLGYFDWYVPGDLDGRTAVTTIAANVALDNGLIMFEAIGNAGPAPTSLGAPADADRLIAVGAVRPNGTLAGFSSRGPTADGRIKPDVCGPGNPTWVASLDGTDEYLQGSGTSFAAPLVAGVGALLLQAYPNLQPNDMASLLRETASRAGTPDNDYGWGIVQGFAAAGLYCTCEDLDVDGAYASACGGDDCDDADPLSRPGVDERCNGRDDDCDGQVPEIEGDRDGDGVRPCEGDCDDDDPERAGTLIERCDDGRDNDCDDLADAEDPDCARGTSTGAVVDETGMDGSSSVSGGIGETARTSTEGPERTDESGTGSPSANASEGGCACTSGAKPSMGGWLVWFAVAVIGRRRRGVSLAPGRDGGGWARA